MFIVPSNSVRGEYCGLGGSLTLYSYIGYLSTHERYFLGLDTLPLLCGITAYTYFWPGIYITPESRVAKDGIVGSEVSNESPVLVGDEEQRVEMGEAGQRVI